MPSARVKGGVRVGVGVRGRVRVRARIRCLTPGYARPARRSLGVITRERTQRQGAHGQHGGH
eukprot:scaffold112529_cov15-Phaeocystis_antarctica.AAC.1